MRFSDISLASLVAAPLVAAHADIPGAPKIWGLSPSDIAKLKIRNAFSGHEARDIKAEQGPQLQARQGGQNGRCGSAGGGASCAAGYCCSSAGYCGQGGDFCSAPDCQFQFGPGCDANKTPAGTSTSGVSRAQLGSVAYGGEGVYACRVPGTVAITYDDGPYTYTNNVMDLFKSYNAKATFFVTGINIGKGAIDDASKPWPGMLRRMISEGHQVASHTWSHQDLSAITSAQRRDQMIKNEMAISNVIGKFPTYMRPPYSSCTAGSGCQADMGSLGYVISYFDLDTDDYNQLTREKIQNAKNNVNNALNGKNPANDDFLAIAHDIHELTANNLTSYMLQRISQAGYRMVTMGECMGQAESTWYRTGRAGGNPPTNPTNPPAGGKVSTDGTCAGTNGFTCNNSGFGNCCSQYGWCGSTTGHCGTGCNGAFGTCSGGGGTTPPPATKPVSTDGNCAGTKQQTCQGSAFGNCCSQYGWCGTTAGHCGGGCQGAFGTCNVSFDSSVLPDNTTVSPTVFPSPVIPSPSDLSSVSALSSTVSFDLISSVAPSPTNDPASPTSINLTSGSSRDNPAATPSTATTTLLSITTLASPTTSSTTPPSASPSINTSTNGRCGALSDKQTCIGYGDKNCCSLTGRCGNDLFACGLGCQKNYGKGCFW
ncbi:hypothetical protein B0J11DRAFT_259352 [Dendryphion nanum]|uniref:Carbohydrate esterase family 4 protein n=1 Tax=Dendryphion nanum TaxID=256645 RepID=A0A9P9E433_9PLEO|nr:hypothetical protein B0J11DRAFT_259352 [Dendryphion nanum]